MNVFTSFSFASSAAALVLGGYVLAVLSRSRIGRLLCALSILGAVVSFSQGMVAGASTPSQAAYWDGFASLWPLMPALQLHLALELTRPNRLAPWLLPLGYLSAAALSAMFVADLFVRVPVRGALGWVVPRPGGPAAAAITAWIVAISLAALVPTVRAGRGTRDRLAARRARVATAAIAGYLVIGGVVDGPLRALGRDLPPLSPGLFIFVAIALVVGIIKGSPIVMTDAAIAREVLDSMPDAVLFADESGRVAFANRAAAALFGRGIEDLGGMTVAELLSCDAGMTSNGAVSQCEGIATPASGQPVHVSTTWMPLRSRMGGRAGSVYALHDLTSHKRVESDLQGALAVKDTFLANVSHELRTPLNSILGFTVVILQGHAGPLTPEQRRQLRMSERAARQLLGMVDDMLEVSGTRPPETDQEPVPVDASELIRPVVVLLNQRAHEKMLALRIEEPLPTARFLTEPGRAQQVLINLVGNAIKFTEHGSVTVSASVSDSHIDISVRDTGMGIADHDLPHITRRFHQLTRPDGRKPDGAGLGLTISERYAQRLGGELVVSSRLGAGSTFTLRLPLAGPRTDSDDGSR